MKLYNSAIENDVPGYSAELVSRARQTLASVEQTLRTWSIRARTRRALKDLSPRLLDDVRMDRAQARQEASKPFWQE